MSTLEKIASKVFIWQRLNHVVFFLRNVLLAWFISPAQYGIFEIAFNLVSFFTLLTTFDFRTAILTTKQPSKTLWDTQWSLELLLALTALVFGLAATPFLISTRGTEITICLLLLLICGLIESLASSKLYLMEKNMEFPFLTTLRTIINLVSFLLCLGFASAGWGWKALAIDRLFTALFFVAVLWRRSDLKPSFRIVKEDVGYLWTTIKVLFISGAFYKIAFVFDVYAVGKWLGEEQAGLYRAAMKWAVLPMEIGGGFLAVMALSWYSRHAHMDVEAMAKSYGQITFHLVRFCSWVAVGVGFFLPDLFQRFYKPEWQIVPTVFQVLLPYVLFRALHQNYFQFLFAVRKNMAALGAAILHAVTLVVLCMIALPWGVWGITLATSVSLVLSCLFMEYQVRVILKQSSLSLLAFPLITAAVALILREWGCWHFEEGQGWFIIRLILFSVYSGAAFLEWKSKRGNYQSDSVVPIVSSSSS